MEPIRILRIIARLNVGGPAIQAVKLSGGLSGPEYRTLLVCGNVSPGEGDMSYLALSEGVKPNVLSGFGREISPFDDFRSFRSLRRIIHEFKPQVIHTHTAKAGTLGRLAGLNMDLLPGLRRKIRFVHTFHGHVFEGYFGPRKTSIFIHIERFLARFTDRIIVISPLQFTDICQKYRIAPPEKVRLIRLGFDLAPFCEACKYRKEARRNLVQCECEDTLVVGIIGRLTRIKNHRMFLDAIKVLKDRGQASSFRFLIIGDGEMRGELEEYARKLEIEGHVVFAGWQREMVRSYGAMDAVALTSMNEGTPVTLIEAMAARVPVVATAVGGVPDLLGGSREKFNGYQETERGMLVRKGDPQALAEALLFLLKNRERFGRISEKAKEFVLSTYRVERLLEDMNSLYREVLQDTGQ